MTTALPKKLYFRPKEVAEHFDVHVRTVYTWIEVGVISEPIKIGGIFRIKREELVKLINGST